MERAAGPAVYAVGSLAVESRLRRIGLIGIAVLALAVLSVRDLASTQGVRASTLLTRDDTSARLDSILSAASRRLDFQGSVLIAHQGRVLLRKGYGYADVARHVRNSPNTRFRISSLTTMFNEIALLQVEERGKLSLERSVCAYLAACPASWRPMTVRLLIDGRSGLPTISSYPKRTRSLAAWINWLRARPLAFKPDKGRDRSEARFLLSAYLLEQVSGQSWISYLTRNIFQPVGMTSTGLDRPNAPRRATPYVRTRQRKLVRARPYLPLSEPDVVNGLMSSVDDMYRFDQAVHSGRLVPVEKLRPGWRNHVELGHSLGGTADGWYAADTHRGDDDVLILAFSNIGRGTLPDLESALFFAASDWPPLRIRLDADTLRRYLGRYTWRDSYFNRLVTITVTPATDGLLRIHWNRWPPRLHGFRTRPLEALIAPVSETEFFLAKWLRGGSGPGWTFAFEVAPEGRVAAVVAGNKVWMRPVRYRRVS
jgi:CubicO group peptidase (beta-lactamase class C family)